MLASDTSCAAQASRPPERSQPHQLDSGTPSWVPTTLRSYACLLPFTLSFLAMQQGSAHPPPPVTPASSMVSGNPAEVGRLKQRALEGAAFLTAVGVTGPGEFSPGWLFTATEAVES